MLRFVAIASLTLATAACTSTTDADYIDPRPQFDAEGNPNFDEDGNYIGCHGVGCEVDPVD
ncbi:hypothetical protein [Pelagibacterium sp. H642]|uniref:hypothetical protein n=1 Tax=Pelagibacterium sp. H642 TaxID=1881069 RepID=UPI002815BF54|nr:hypothetical protein [Pelagibacterium sp. H642]WMT92520.1 hypothetical protein NO934_06795 [Pelagibacterium sp. H642]